MNIHKIFTEYAENIHFEELIILSVKRAKNVLERVRIALLECCESSVDDAKAEVVAFAENACHPLCGVGLRIWQRGAQRGWLA